MSCVIDVDNDNGYVINEYEYKQTTRTREVKCNECGQVIKPGESFTLHTGLEDAQYYKETVFGKDWVFHECTDCASIRKTFFCNFYFSSG